MKTVNRLLLLFVLCYLSACGGSTNNTGVMKSSLAPAPSGSILRFAGPRNDYTITQLNGTYQVQNISNNITTIVKENNILRFDDMNVNLFIAGQAKQISATQLNQLLELYVAFFNRVPDAEGLSYWIEQIQQGLSIDQIATSFYQAAIQYSAITGYTNSMSSNDFVKVIYKNVLGRTGASEPPQEDVSYWASSLDNRSVSKGKLVQIMLNAAHSFKNDPDWGWVPQLLDNKIEVAHYFSVAQGLSFNSNEDSITKGMAIAAAITPSDTMVAKILIAADPALSRGPAIPDNLWAPPSDKIPASGNYVYLESETKDRIGQGKSYLYTNGNARFSIFNDHNHLQIRVEGNQNWIGDFQTSTPPNKLLRGYYGNLERFPFNVSPHAGMSWSGEGNACNTLTGWFTLDKTEIVDGVVVGFDMRFVQYCDSAQVALRGAIHWQAKDANNEAIGPKPIPTNLWQPAANNLPTSGNYLYLLSDYGDFIGGGRSYLYTSANAVFNIQYSYNVLSMGVQGDQSWTGFFEAMKGYNPIKPGYYPFLRRHPFHNPLFGGLSWIGEGRGCNESDGWVAVDRIIYNNDEVSEIELRFEQSCDGNPALLHGKLRWSKDDRSNPPAGPLWPIPDMLWKPPVGMPPTTNRYIYLQSDAGDWVGSGQIFSYTPENANVSIKVGTGLIEVAVSHKDRPGEYWMGSFQAMNSIPLFQPGYYGNLRRYPFHNATAGGLDWSGSGHGCNKLAGYFVIDKIRWSDGAIAELDLRFEQLCDGSQSALHGQIHWVF